MTKKAEKKIEMLLESILDILAMGPTTITTPKTNKKQKKVTVLPSMDPKKAMQTIASGSINREGRLAPIKVGGK